MRMMHLINSICNVIRAMYPILKDAHKHISTRKKKPGRSWHSNRDDFQA